MKRKLKDVQNEDASHLGDHHVENDKKIKLQAKDHKISMRNLAQKDPEFYQFLKANDDNLLNFDEDSSEESDEENYEGAIHIPPDKLHVASDDSETDDDHDEKIKPSIRKPNKITKNMIDHWCTQLKEAKPISTVFDVMNTFKAVVERVTEESGVHDSIAFNGVLRVCLLDLIPAVNRILRVSDSSVKPTSSKMWRKIQIQMKSYLSLMVKILSFVSQEDLVKSVLKHISQLVPYYSVFPKISKNLLKKLVHLWASAQESVRVLSFFSIWRVTRSIPNEVLKSVVKDMYLAYVQNCKYTTPSRWHLINFMKKSFADILSLNESVMYQNAFVYIRQLAIHLRNALAVKKKDSMKPVYNWQFVHCLYLWSHVVSCNCVILQSLVYPLVQVIVGTIKLSPTAKYVPLRFHCVRALLAIAKETNTTIPVLPLITEVLKFVNISKKHNKLSWKKMDLSCALKLSRSQLSENAFKESLVETSYELLLSFLDTQSNSIAFPELILPTGLCLKHFLRERNVPAYSKQFKQLLDKMEENAKFIEYRRRRIAFNLSNSDAVIDWETTTKREKPPLSTYYQQYSQVTERERSQKKVQCDETEPDVGKRDKSRKDELKKLDRDEFNQLFAQSDSDDESPFIVTKRNK